MSILTSMLSGDNGKKKVSERILKMFGADGEQAVEKAQASPPSHGYGTRVETVTVHRQGKEFQRKQKVGVNKKEPVNVESKQKDQSNEKVATKKKEESADKGSKDIVQIAESHIKTTDTSVLKKYIKSGDNQELIKMASEELKSRGEKVREPQWYDGISKEYGIKPLPVGVPKNKITFNNAKDPHSTWFMTWKDPKTGVDKHAYTAEHDSRQAKEKFMRVAGLPATFTEDVYSKAKKQVSSTSDVARQSGLILAIMADTGLRIGDIKKMHKTGNEGVSTLKVKSIKIKGDTIHLDFIGKSYKRNTAAIKDAFLAKELGRLIEGEDPESLAFPKADRITVMNMFRDKMGYKKNKLKDIRTMVACNTASKYLYGQTPPPPLPSNQTKARKMVADKLKGCFEFVSNKLNNSPIMAKNSYVNPVIIQDYLKKIGGEDIQKAIGEDDDIKIPTLKQIADRNMDYIGDDYKEQDVVDDTDDDDEEGDIEYRMPDWMEKLFDEFYSPEEQGELDEDSENESDENQNNEK